MDFFQRPPETLIKLTVESEIVIHLVARLCQLIKSIYHACSELDTGRSIFYKLVRRLHP